VSKKVTIQQFAAQPTSDFSMVSFRKSYAWFALLSYFRKHLRSVNGLVESIFGRWHGLGAEQLGLAQGSAVTEEQFGRLCKNQHPTLTKTGVLGFGTAVRLTARKFFTREDGPSRIACYSFVFCPPKSVSITSMFDTRIEPLHNKWVEATLDEMQKDAKGAFGQLIWKPVSEATSLWKDLRQAMNSVPKMLCFLSKHHFISLLANYLCLRPPD
jgi:hypothetical protein